MEHQNVLAKRAVLVAVNISRPSFTKEDRAITADVAARLGLVGKPGRYRKDLLYGNDPDPRKPVQRAANDIRTYAYANTLAWGDDGFRILPIDHYMEFSQEIGGRVAEYERQCADFVNCFPRYQARAERALGALYKPADYPDEDRLRAMHGASVSFRPISDFGADFRTAIGDAEMAILERDLKAEMAQAQALAMRDLCDRLRETAQHCADKTGATSREIWRDSLIGNLNKIARLVPRLNVTGDPELNDLADQIRRDLAPDRVCADRDALRQHCAELRGDMVEKHYLSDRARAIADAAGRLADSRYADPDPPREDYRQIEPDHAAGEARNADIAARVKSAFGTGSDW